VAQEARDKNQNKKGSIPSETQGEFVEVVWVVLESDSIDGKRRSSKFQAVFLRRQDARRRNSIR